VLAVAAGAAAGFQAGSNCCSYIRLPCVIHAALAHSSLCSAASATFLPSQGTQSGNSAFKMPTIQTYCKQQCSKCVAAANDKKQCPNSNSALPAACSQGLAFNAQVKSVMNKCADMYMKDPSALRKVPGC
jgi:hypothetical protein